MRKSINSLKLMYIAEGLLKERLEQRNGKAVATAVENSARNITPNAPLTPHATARAPLRRYITVLSPLLTAYTLFEDSRQPKYRGG